jgi:hypothetical protein
MIAGCNPSSQPSAVQVTPSLGWPAGSRQVRTKKKKRAIPSPPPLPLNLASFSSLVPSYTLPILATPPHPSQRSNHATFASGDKSSKSRPNDLETIATCMLISSIDATHPCGTHAPCRMQGNSGPVKGPDAHSCGRLPCTQHMKTALKRMAPHPSGRDGSMHSPVHTIPSHLDHIDGGT